MKKTLIVAALALTAAACGGSSKKTTANATLVCDWRTVDATCAEVSAPAAALTAANYTSAECTNTGGTIVAACPASGRTGRCAITQASASGSIAVVWHIYDPAFGQADCTAAGGTWTVG